MGGTSYSASVTASYLADHKAAGTSAFMHDADIRSGVAAKKVHALLDPSKLNAAGKNVRESFDSDVHPTSVPVAVLFDVTGSMAMAPRIFIEKLPNLMAAMVKKGYLEHPHILFGAVGDATCDLVPLQVGQFEGGNEMDMALANIYLEGMGGGQDTESYELAMYYMARHTDLDSVKKRGKKGYLFLIGDERPYPKVNKNEVKKIIGDDLQDHIETPAILAELREKFEVFWIMPGGTSHFTDDGVIEPLKKLFGQNFSKLEEPSDICEAIITIIGLMEGYDLNDVAGALKDIGADDAAVARATKSLVAFADTVPAKAAKATDDLVPVDADAASRL